MDTNKWRPSQVGEAAMDAGDWRSQLQADSRQRIVNKIMDTLKRHLPFSGQDGLQELSKIAVRFEEKIYTAATSQSDYLWKISLKMLTMETKSQNSMGNPLQSNSTGTSNRPPDPGSFGMQPQVPNQGQSLSMLLPTNQSQGCQPVLSQNIQNNIPPAGVQSSFRLSSALPPSSGLTQTRIPSIVGQNPNMQYMSRSSQNSLGNSMGQGVPSNIFANSQKQMPGRQQVVPQQQQPQQSQNSQQYMYHQQMQHSLLKPKYQQGNMPQLVQQQQQQNLLQPTQLQSSQQSVMPTSSVMQPSVQSSLSSLQQNQQSAVQQSSQSMLQQHSQPVLRQQQQPQQAAVHQQQTPMAQQPILPPQQQQPPLMVQQPTASNLSQNQMIGQQNNVGDMQHQQQQRLLSQQNNLLNLQQQQQQQQQQRQQQQQQQRQLMAQQSNLSNIHQQQLGPQSNVTGLQQQQQSNLSNMHQQQLGSQSNVTGLQQQQHLGTQSGNSSMQPNQHSVHLLQQSKVQVQQQQHQNASNMLPTQGQQSQPQVSQQQMMSQIQSQPAQMQQMGLQQQSNPLQRDMQQRLQASGQISGTMLQAQNVMDQQKQLYRSQRTLPETSSTSLDSSVQTGYANGGDWQEEVYQKIKVMKERYLPELSEMYQKIATKLQQHDSLPQQPKSEQLEKLKMFKTMLERLISVLQISKSSISPGLKDKLGLYEKQIVNFINTNRPRKQDPLQQGQLPPPHMHSMQQPQSQIPQVQSHENQMNPQLQTMNLQASVPTMQQNNMTRLEQNSMSSISGVSTAQQNMMNSLQPSTNLDSGQGNALNSLQQVPVGSIQQTPVSAPQQANIIGLSSQSGVSMLQPNIISLQPNSGMLQHQQLKQQEQQMFQNQLKQQYQQRMQQQLIQKQQILQQQQQQQQLQQAKQQLPAQMEANQHQMPQLHQMNDANDLKMRQGMGVKPGVFQQHISAGQRAYPHQQLKLGSPFPIPPSNQLLQAASPQISQHSSPQVDLKNLLTHPKAGTPLQTAGSPFVIPSPSTPMVPSPMPGDFEKPSSLPNAGNIGHQQGAGVGAPVQSLAIGTRGMLASPLLAEFSLPDASHVNALSTIYGKSSVTEQPLERLIKAVKSMWCCYSRRRCC